MYNANSAVHQSRGKFAVSSREFGARARSRRNISSVRSKDTSARPSCRQ